MRRSESRQSVSGRGGRSESRDRRHRSPSRDRRQRYIKNSFFFNLQQKFSLCFYKILLKYNN